jgi:hypothetical protein
MRLWNEPKRVVVFSVQIHPHPQHTHTHTHTHTHPQAIFMENSKKCKVFSDFYCQKLVFMENKYNIRNHHAKIYWTLYFSSWNIFDENLTLYSPLAFYIGNTLRWQTEFLVYFRMLIPNIVLIFHKNKLLTIKIIKYFAFFGIFHTNGPSVSPRSRSKRTLRTKTKYEFSHNSTSSKKLAYSEIAG